MVVGGYSTYDTAEIYDLSGQNLNCPTIADPLVDYGSVGTFINNKALVCGGGSPYTSVCYSYNMQVNNVLKIITSQIINFLFLQDSKLGF